MRFFRRQPSIVTRINQYVPPPISVPGAVVLHGSQGEVVGYMPKKQAA